VLNSKKKSSISLASTSKVLVNPQSVKKKVKSDTMSLTETNSSQILSMINSNIVNSMNNNININNDRD